MNKEKFLMRLNKVAAFIFVGLFFWILWPVKWLKKLAFRVKLHKAKEDARCMSMMLNKAVYVVQNGTELAVGTRESLREWNKQQKKNNPEFLDIDYRHAVVFKAINGKDYTTVKV